MRIAIASGKGGTGKTTIAVGLAVSAPQAVRLLDCDVEEPNCHIFLKPQIQSSEPVCVPVPEVDSSKCDLCGKCSSICQFSAIVVLKKSVLTFPELCHGCGGCLHICPQGAIREIGREVGVREKGRAGDIQFHQGRLRIGETMAPPLIQAVKEGLQNDRLNLIDCPPGTSCPVIAAVQGSDYVILVTEPTPFGLHDLTLAVETMRQLGLAFGVIINRADIGDNRVADYCRAESIPILMQIPDDRKIAEAYSQGRTIVEAEPKLRETFRGVLHDIASSLGRVPGEAQKITEHLTVEGSANSLFRPQTGEIL